MNLIREVLYLTSVAVVVAMALPLRQQAIAQGKQEFAVQGATEVGGSIAIQSVTPVYNGATGDATTIVSFMPFAGYFVADGWELGVDPLGITTSSTRGNSSTTVLILLAPSYNFKTKSIIYPFVEGLVGYGRETVIGDKDGLSWGGRAGVKLAIAGNGLLNLAIEYLQVNLNSPYDVSRNGSNQLEASAGFTLWF